MNSFIARALILSALLIQIGLPISAQHYYEKFQDGYYEDFTILTSDAKSLPKFFAGFRATANPFIQYENSGKLLIKADFAAVQVGLFTRSGVDCIFPIIRRSPKGKSNKIRFGGSITNQVLVYNWRTIRINNLVKVLSIGPHIGYNYVSYSGDAKVQTSYSENYFNLSNFRGHEFVLGLGIYTRRGFAVMHKSSNPKIDKNYLQYHNFLVSYNLDLIINAGYKYTAKHYAIYGDTLAWNNKYFSVPNFGGQFSIDFYWNPGWSKKDRLISWGWSGRAAVRKNFIQGLNAAYFVPEFMFGIYFNLIPKSKFQQAAELPDIDIFIQKGK